VDTCQQRPFGLDAQLMSKGPQRQFGLSLAALDRRLGQIKCRLLLCSSADSATATRRRGDAEAAQIASASEESIDPVVFAGPGCPLAATNVCPNACRIGEPTLRGLFR
jgi:hypothetical protein